MIKKYRFHIGLTLLVQSASFIILFFMLYKKKKSLANTFLALSAVGGIAGAYLVLKEAKCEVEACEQAAKDACENGVCGDEFDFDACEEFCALAYHSCGDLMASYVKNMCNTVREDCVVAGVEERYFRI